MEAQVGKILIYPIKALDGVERDRASVVSPGTLEFDRRWAIVDEKGKYVNGKRNPKVHQLRSQFDLTQPTVSLQKQGEATTATFNLVTEIEKLNQWLSDYFEKSVFLRENPAGGFPDDTEAYGPTIISTATLETVASWFSGLSVENARSRFRANIELSGVPPFWEDQLFSTANSVVNFQVGNVEFAGVNPCQRCVVPTRNPHTAETYPQFQKVFTQNRQATLPPWSNPTRFNHYYRLSINTRILDNQIGKLITIGDQLTINL
ncbi:MAG: MOSC domain-containing protein [Halothece sp.]